MSLTFQVAAEQYRQIREEYEVVRYAAYDAAEEATRGAMVNRRGAARGVSGWDLFTHNELYARAYASEELVEHWARQPRPTFAAFERQMVEGIGA